MLHLFDLFFSLRVKMTFLAMGRFGKYGEQTYRTHFGKDFDFKEFNRLLVEAHCGEERILIFDPSYINKSGKHTPGVGYFWSGSAGNVKWGLELSSLAVGDVVNHTALHYQAIRTTFDKKSGETSLLDYYADLLVNQAESLQKISKTIVLDAFFSKMPFVSRIQKAGFTMVSRLQSNIHLRYQYQGEQHGGRGRKKVMGDKIELQNINTAQFKIIQSNDENIIYEGVAHVRCLKSWCKLVIVHILRPGKAPRVLVYFSTDTEMDGFKVLEYYKMRYQIEFVFRDAKGHLGLEDTQSRQPQALDFHFNASLTALNIAKVAHWYSKDKNQRGAFSIRDIKTQYANQLVLDRLILIYGKDPNVEINNPDIRNLYNLGSIAA